MSKPQIQMDIEDILGDKKPEQIEIAKCVASSMQMRQSHTKVSEDDQLVSQIRKMGGLLHPIIVKKLDDGTYEVLVGQRRTNAYHILKKENSKYEKIRAYVIERDISDDEKRVISFIENAAVKTPSKIDYTNVIEYFYMKCNRNMTHTAEALGISWQTARNCLTVARLPDDVKKCIDKKEFSIDTAMKALQGLGDDEESVDSNILIETAKQLKTMKPLKRNAVVTKMDGGKKSLPDAEKEVKVVKAIRIDVTDDQWSRLQKYQSKHSYENEIAAAEAAMDTELLRDLER